MNKTVRVGAIAFDQKRADENDAKRRAATIETRGSQNGQDAVMDLMETSITGTRWVDKARTDLIKNRVQGKASVSPDKYVINNNLVVNLAEPI